jgi:ketosteroid isomerase-like protein
MPRASGSMTARALICVVFLLTVPSGLEPQTLSAAQQEVWKEELRYWNLRTAGKIDEHMALWHEDVTAWGSTLQKPGTKADVRDNVAGVLRDTRPGSYTADLEPLVIRIHGEFAFVFYRVREVRSDLAGNRRESRVRVTHTWWRTRGGWQIIAGMGAADSN